MPLQPVHSRPPLRPAPRAPYNTQILCKGTSAMPITQDRLIALVEAAERAILKNKVFANITLAFIDNQRRQIIKSLHSKGFDDTHPLSPEITQLFNFIDELYDRANESLDIESVITLTKEKERFSPTRQKRNEGARDRMRTMRQERQNATRGDDYYL